MTRMVGCMETKLWLGNLKKRNLLDGLRVNREIRVSGRALGKWK